MSIVGIGSETFLYVNGISTTNALQLADDILLLPINTELQFDNVSRLIPSDIDYSVAVLCAPNISSQLKYSLQGTTQGNGLTGGLPPVRFSM